MEKPILYIFRGCPGSGKSSAARIMAKGVLLFEADQFFMVNKNYKWDSKCLKVAHNDFVKDEVERIMKNFQCDIAVANTFMQAEYIEPFLKFAQKYFYNVKIYNCIYRDGMFKNNEVYFKRDLTWIVGYENDPIFNSVHFNNISENKKIQNSQRYRNLSSNPKNNQEINDVISKYNEIVISNEFLWNVYNVDDEKWYTFTSTNLLDDSEMRQEK